MNVVANNIKLEKIEASEMPAAPTRRNKKCSSCGVYSVLLVDHRHLTRESLAQHITSRAHDMQVLGAASVKEIVDGNERLPHHVTVLNIGAASIDAPEIMVEIAELQAMLPGSPVAVLADCDLPHQAAKGRALGLRGYIPSDLDIDIMLAVLRLLAVGGTFLSIDAVGHGSRRNGRLARNRRPGGAPGNSPHHFTARQTEVLECLSQGKPNKIIAHELAMSESTVKVHVHSILKKLNASNRAQVAYLMRESLSSPLWEDGGAGA